jgi:hypothetical protein
LGFFLRKKYRTFNAEPPMDLDASLCRRSAAVPPGRSNIQTIPRILWFAAGGPQRPIKPVSGVETTRQVSRAGGLPLFF